MYKQVRGVLVLCLAAAFSACGGVRKPAAAPVSLPTGASAIALPQNAGLPADTAFLARVHGVDSAWKLGRGWAGFGPDVIAQVIDGAEAIDWELGGGFLATLDKDANVDQLLGGESYAGVHGIAVLAIKDLNAVSKRFPGKYADVAPGRTRFRDEEDAELHTRVLCDMQRTHGNAGYVICADELGMQKLYAPAVTSLMALRPDAQFHSELHIEPARPLINDVLARIEGAASLAPAIKSWMGVNPSSLAMLAELSELVVDAQLEPAGLRVHISEHYPKAESDAVKAWLVPAASGGAKAAFAALPSDTFAAGYIELNPYADLAAILKNAKSSLDELAKLASAKAPPARKDDAEAFDVLLDIAARFASTKELVVAGGVDPELFRTMISKAIAKGHDGAELSADDVPAHFAFWYDGKQLLTPADIAKLRSFARKKKATKQRKPGVMEPVPAKLLPDELKDGAVLKLSDGTDLKSTVKQHPLSFYVADVAFMKGRMLVVATNLPTITSFLRRASAQSNDKIANVSVLRERAANANERAYGYLRSDLLVALSPLCDFVSEKKMGGGMLFKMLGAMTGFFEAVQSAPKMELIELARKADNRHLHTVYRVPANVFVALGRLGRAVVARDAARGAHDEIQDGMLHEEDLQQEPAADENGGGTL